MTSPTTPTLAPKPRRRRHFRRWAGGLFLLAWVASQVWRQAGSVETAPSPEQEVLALEGAAGAPLRIAWRSRGDPERPALVLLHGSPGRHDDFRHLAPGLARSHLVLAPDLPGFGASSRRVPDYSNTAHARAVLSWLDTLGIERAHLLGFSMGGGVALRIAEMAPQRVRSLTLLASLGVQEFELLGDAFLNRQLHRLQLAALWCALELIPHFGALDEGILNLRYARNFLDNDQTGLRRVLRDWEGPMLIVHGEEDFLVPVAAAREHARIVPQAELVVFPDRGHFFLFREETPATEPVLDFLERVESGEALRRDEAAAARRRAALAPFDPNRLSDTEDPGGRLLPLLAAGAVAFQQTRAPLVLGEQVRAGWSRPGGRFLGAWLGLLGGSLVLYLLGLLVVRPCLALVGPAPRRRSARGTWWLTGAARVVPFAWMPLQILAGAWRWPFRRWCLATAVWATLATPVLLLLPLPF